MQNIEPLAVASFSYDYEDYSLEYTLAKINKMFPDNVLISNALGYVANFMLGRTMDAFEGGGISIKYRLNGEFAYIDFELSPDRLAIVSGGIARSNSGSDSYSTDVWSLDAGDQADFFYDMSREVC